MIKRLFEFCLATLLFAGAAQAATVTIDNATVRAMPVGVPNTAGYIELTATGNDDALLAATCDGIKTTELHTLLMDGGVMKMRPVERIALPQGETVELTQGGYHLMMMGVSKTPVEGEQISCTLQFETAPAQTVQFAVKRIDNHSAHHHHH